MLEAGKAYICRGCYATGKLVNSVNKDFAVSMDKLLGVKRSAEANRRS